MGSITQYNEKGEIVNSIFVADPALMKANQVGLWVEGFGLPETHYVANGALALRLRQQTALTGAVLTNLPVPCQIKINDETYDCEDDHAEIDPNLPGTYRITVTAWPYLDAEFTYEN